MRLSVGRSHFGNWRAISYWSEKREKIDERIMAVKSFPVGVSVTAQTVFNAIVNEVCDCAVHV